MHKITTILTATLILILGWCSTSQAQNVLEVEWQDDEGFIIVNALRDAIIEDQENGAPDGRVYQLKAGGFYWNTSRIDASNFDLRIIGEEPEDGVLPPILQPRHDGDGGWDEKMIVAGGDLELRNFWLIGRTNQGNEGWGVIDFNGENAEIIIDNIVVEYNFSAFFHAQDSGQDITITNTHFRNLIDHDQYWAGRILRTESPTRSIRVENNTFFNIGHTTIQAEYPEGDLWYNHNTVVNTGRGVIGGNQWQNAYITNNLFINGFWHGEVGEDFSAARRQQADNQVGSWVSIDDLNPELGFNSDRIIVIQNNAHWVSPELDEYYTHYLDDIGEELGGPGDYESTGEVRAAPFLNIRAQNLVDEYEQIVWDNHLDLGTSTDIGLQFYEDGNFADLAQNMIDWVDAIRLDSSEDPPEWYWEMDGRDTSGDMLSQTVADIYPIADNAENFSFTHSGALSHAVGGYPVGNLNWFPEQKQAWEQEREDLEQQIREGFETDPFLLRGTVEAETGILTGDAEVQEFDGFAYFFLESGSIVWTFNMEDGGEYGLNVHHNMGNEAQRGQNILVNGVNLRNDEGFGEYFWGEGTPQDEWLVEEIRNAGLYEGEIVMEEGENQVEISASWGWQSFSGIEIVDANGDVVHELGIFDAAVSGGNLNCQDEAGGEDSDFCPSGGAYVALGSGGEISIDFDAVGSGDYLIQILYQLENGSAEADLEINGEFAENVVFDNDSGEQEVVVASVHLEAGVREVNLVGTVGSVNIDAFQFFAREGTWVSVDDTRASLPRGFELRQNYPNPFNPNTNIEFSLPQASDVKIQVFDAIGRQVATLVNGQYSAGSHTVHFDASNLASGMYIYRMQAGDIITTRKMTLIK